MTLPNHHRSSSIFVFACIFLVLGQSLTPSSITFAQTDSDRSLTPLQLEIAKQRNRLSAVEIEERRDAVVRLSVLHHPDASRAALAALNDIAPIVRATAVVAVLALPQSESASALIPMLGDKDEFVRQEAAYALGKTRSTSAVAPLIERLANDKKHSVRGAAIVALGDIGDASAVVPLSQVLRPEMAMTNSKKKKGKSKENVLVLRAAAHSLGQIGNAAGVPALLAAVQDESADDDVRRESAKALGLIGDPAALPALNSLQNAADPYLSLAAHEASRKISQRQGSWP